MVTYLFAEDAVRPVNTYPLAVVSLGLYHVRPLVADTVSADRLAGPSREGEKGL